jgi:stage II sporulation protein D
MGNKMVVMLAVIVIIFTCTAPGVEAGAQETIRVGLKFDTTAPAAVSIGSDSGIEFGYDTGSGFISLYTHTGKSGIFVRKDSFFTDKNGLLIEVGQGTGSPSDVDFGPYHLQISEPCADLQKAYDLLQEISNKGLEGYIAYDNGWRVWTGRYTGIQEMERKKCELADRIGGKFDIYPVYPYEGRLQVNDQRGKVVFMYEGGDEFFIARPLDEGIIRVDGKRFRGSIEFKRQNGGNITVVNSLPLKHYLYGVVPREVSPSWHMEALKAQAVAARNFAVVNIGKHGPLGFDVCSGTDCQVYGGFDSESPSTNAAVDETVGQLIYYEGSPITAFYHASSGGHTENAENVWSISLPYIKAVDDSFDSGSPHESWERVYTSQQISTVLAQHGISIGSIQDIQVESYTPAGRSLALTIQGSRGSTVLEKERSRAIFGYNDLKSTLFTVDTDADLFVLGEVGQQVQKVAAAHTKAVNASGIKTLDDGPDVLTVRSSRNHSTINKFPTRFIFRGKGWGHGLGMSQWGAKGMAEAGYSHKEILEYYYQGCVVQ